jgi:hypothetical protein
MKLIRSSKCSLKFATKYKLNELKIILTEYGKVCNIFIEYFWKNGRIRYEKGAFYMDSLKLVDITMNEKEFSSEGKLQKIIINLIKNYLDSFPVYRLKQSDFKQEIARLFLKDIVVEGDSLKVIIGL